MRQIGGFECMADKTKNYKTGFYCFSAKHAALRSKSKDWLDRNTNNVFEWDDMSNSRSCLSCHCKNQTKSVSLVQSGPRHHLFEITCSHHDI